LSQGLPREMYPLSHWGAFLLIIENFIFEYGIITI